MIVSVKENRQMNGIEQRMQKQSYRKIQLIFEKKDEEMLQSGKDGLFNK